MKRLSGLVLGLSLLVLSGCFCGPHGWPCWGGGYGAGCPTGNCNVAPGGVPYGGSVPQGAVPGYNMQTNYPQQTIPGPVAVEPAAYPQMATQPLDPLPTY